MIKKVGKFITSSDVLRITDPCYKKGTWCSGTLENCEVGEWSGFLIDSDEEDWGIRIAENIAIFGDVSVEDAQKILDEGSWKNSNIDVGVDSGQAGIFDDSKYPEGEPGEYGDLNSFYGKCCQKTLGKPQGGVINFGVVSSSGYGDGSYDCFYLTKNDKVFAIRIIFIDMLEQNFEDED